MTTKVIKVDPFQPSDETLASCAEVLRSGGLVAFPTETVYGLGANALLPGAVDKVYEAKGRPGDNPLIVHVARTETVASLADEVSPVASRLMDLFWPGPLTLLFPRSPVIPDRVTAGLPSVAIRMPDHPVAQRLIDLAGVPVAAPSANVSGRPSPTSFEAVYADLAGKVDIIIDGGPTGIGVESTVLDISGPVPRILRPGGLSLEELSNVLGRVDVAGEAGLGPALSPGMKYRHYAPRGVLLAVRGDPSRQRETILLEALRLLSCDVRKIRVAVLASSENLAAYRKLQKHFPDSFFVIELGPRSDLSKVAVRLFSSLRYADSLGADVILAESFPRAGLGLAVENRLKTASGGSELPGRQEGPLRVMMVCTGNTCRSPMAEGLFRKAWEELGCPCPVTVISRGTSTVEGLRATPEAVRSMERLGIDIKDHVSAPVTREDLDEADVVASMTSGHRDALLARFPQFSGKVFPLSMWVPEEVHGDVDDPYGLGQEDYDRTALVLQRGMQALARRLSEIVCYEEGMD